MSYTFFDTLLEPTFVINEYRKIIYCNEAAGLLCDMSVRKVLRVKPEINQLFTFKTPVSEFDAIANITEPTPYIEVGYTTESGSTGKVQITIQPSSLQVQEKAWIVYFRNVTLEETLQMKYRGELEQKEGVILDLKKAQEELKHYSENLEKIVAERTKEVVALNTTMRALLDSLKQGFFIFNQTGNCLNVYSKACEDTLEVIPEDKMLWDIFKLKEAEIPGLKDWLTATFTEMLPFQDMIPLAPQTYEHSQGKKIAMEYYPIRNEENKIQSIVGVANDITALVEAQREAEVEKVHAKMILSLVKYRRQFNSFLRDAESIYSTLDYEFAKTAFDADNVFRALHTMKGGSATFSILPVMELCHQAETQLSQWKMSQTSEDETLLKNLYAKIKEEFQKFLVEQSPILGDLNRLQERWIETPVSRLVHFIEEHQFSEPLKSSFTQNFLTEPLNNFISHYSEVMQKVALNECKQVNELIINNKDLALLPEPYEALFNSMIHAFRNAVDHGIETPDVRLEKGKPEFGSISVDAEIISEVQGQWLQFKISDDGAGINPEKIRHKLISKGVDCVNETDEQIIQHVFDSNLSTKEEVTQTSGRGVGMDAIQYAAKQMGGKAWVESVLDKGSTLFIKVPYITNLKLESKEFLKRAA